MSDQKFMKKMRFFLTYDLKPNNKLPFPDVFPEGFKFQQFMIIDAEEKYWHKTEDIKKLAIERGAVDNNLKIIFSTDTWQDSYNGDAPIVYAR